MQFFKLAISIIFAIFQACYIHVITFLSNILQMFEKVEYTKYVIVCCGTNATSAVFLESKGFWFQKRKTRNSTLVQFAAQTPAKLQPKLRLAVFFILPNNPREITETGTFSYMYKLNISKTNWLKDDLNGRLPQWKTTSLED